MLKGLGEDDRGNENIKKLPERGGKGRRENARRLYLGFRARGWIAHSWLAPPKKRPRPEKYFRHFLAGKKEDSKKNYIQPNFKAFPEMGRFVIGRLMEMDRMWERVTFHLNISEMEYFF